MRNIIVLAFALCCMAACKKTDTPFVNSSIVGSWRLSERLIDPGGGMGTWIKADSSNPSYLEFKEDGLVNNSPGNLFHWDHYELTSDSTITLLSGTQEFHLSYHFSKTLLTLLGGCFEACGQKYVPVP
jgi:hypothetical protein